MWLTVLLLVIVVQTGSQRQARSENLIETRAEIETLFTTEDCVWFPCYETQSCEHAVGIPENIRKREGNSSHCSGLQAVTIEWNPSPYGIEFVQGFRVDLVSLSGPSSVSECRQLVLRDGVRLEPQLIIGSTFCLGSDTLYGAVVYGFPVPPGREHHAQQIQFRTNSSYSNGRRANPSTWTPSRLSFTQDGHDVTVSFTAAADTDNINSYHVYHGRCPPGEPAPLSWQHTHMPHDGAGTVQVRLGSLEPGFNYSVVLLSDQEGAERREVTYFVKSEQTGEGQQLTLTLLLVLFALISTVVTVTASHLINNRKQNGKRGEAGFGDDSVSEPFTTQRVSNPRVFLLYPDTASPTLLNVVLHFATFLQAHCACQVVLDMWEELARGLEGRADWIVRQLAEAHFIVVMCWPGGGCPPGPGWGGFFSLGVSLVAEQLLQARISSSGLSRFIVTCFGQCREADVPGVLDLATKYKLMEALPRFFSHLHSLELLGPGLALHVDGISEETYPATPSGFALYEALRLAGEDGSMESATL
uniref:Interleukin-17 receptor D-like n=1 Tax=Callorhinchus milii TaxID=7868 RepID=A0A4W3JWX6_CALMI|eukprot:gi/632978749/ref/XP_007906090.1/ PREDICTED: interleukin-17 receptor D-like [Callorhinchus milii]